MPNELYETKTIIECEECETSWFSTDINRENSADTCECKNIRVGILNMSPPSRGPGYFITIKYSRSYPKIYEIKEKLSDEQLLLADGNKDQKLRGRIGFGGGFK